LGISLLPQGKKDAEEFISSPFFLLAFGMILVITHWKLFLGVSLLCILEGGGSIQKDAEFIWSHISGTIVTQHPLVSAPSMGENLTCK